MKRKGFLITMLLVFIIALSSCGEKEKAKEKEKEVEKPKETKIDKEAQGKWMNKETGLYVCVFENGESIYYIPGKILKKIDSTVNELFMQAGIGKITEKEKTLIVDPDKKEDKTVKEFSLTLKDNKLKAKVAEETYPMEKTKFNYIKSKNYSKMSDEAKEGVNIQFDLVTAIHAEVDNIKKLDDPSKPATSKGVIETDYFIIPSPEGFTAKKFLEGFLMEGKFDDKNNCDIYIKEDKLYSGETLDTIYERIKKAATRAEDVKIDSILGLETKALFTKDELDSRVEILVKYKEKKNNKDYLNITIGRISNKLDPREAFNSPKVKEILSGIKIK